MIYVRSICDFNTMSKGTEKGLDVRPTGGEGANVARLPGWRMWPPVSSAFVWHDWRPFLVVGSRVGGVEEIAGGQGRLGEVAGFLRAPSPQSAPAFPDFFAGCSGGFCLGERGGRPTGRRAVIHGIGSASALVFQVDSESAENAFENQGAIGFPAAQGEFLQSRKSSSSSKAFFRQCGLCAHDPLPPLFPFSRLVPFSQGGLR